VGSKERHLKEEQAWIEEKIFDLLSSPFFFKDDNLVISCEDLENVYKRLKERIWTDRDGQARLWYYRIIVYHSNEEYVWMKILQ